MRILGLHPRAESASLGEQWEWGGVRFSNLCFQCALQGSLMPAHSDLRTTTLEEENQVHNEISSSIPEMSTKIMSNQRLND